MAIPRQSADLPCPYCHGILRLVRHLDLNEMPEIYLFYCSRCQQVETVKQERAAYRVPALASQ
jgi:uncharacterized protein YbaR (Trm112 family)